MERVSSRALLCVLIAVGFISAGCSQIGLLKGKMAFKDANTFYQQQDYKSAAEKYEETLAACKGSEATCTDPRLTSAYFFLGNSYDNQFRPARKGEKTNDDMLVKAIENYKKSAEIEQARADIKKLAMEYLVAAYGPDKLNDPSQAEPILRRMIEIDPRDPSNYTYLSRIYEENGDYQQAEELLLKAREMKPNDAGVYVTLAAFYNRQGEFDKTMEALHARAEKEPTNPEAFYTIATYYWEKAYRDFTTPEADKVKFVAAGLQAADKAIELKPDYFEALTYKNLLLRAQALIEKNPAKQQALIKEADQFRDRATAVRDKQRAANAASTK
jgi:tetratricopeptide (TPR) repeat protein